MRPTKTILLLLLLLASAHLHAEPPKDSDLDYLQKANTGGAVNPRAVMGQPAPATNTDSAPKDAIVPLRAKGEPEREAATPDTNKTSAPTPPALIEVEWVGKDGKPLPKTEAEKEIQELKQRIRRIEAILKKNGLMPINDPNAPQ